MGHAGYLRELWDGDDADFLHFTRTLRATSVDSMDEPLQPRLTHLLDAIDAMTSLQPGDRAMLGYVAKLTINPGRMTRDDLGPLRAAGMDDDAVFDVNQVACMFAYMNRLADGTGVAVHTHHHALAITLFGRAELDAHLEWGAA